VVLIAGLDAVDKRKLFSSCRESNPDFSVILSIPLPLFYLRSSCSYEAMYVQEQENVTT
jgi:hypothetical protein